MSEDIKAVVREHLATEYLAEGEHLDEHTQLIEEEVLDSIAIFTTVTFLEQRFGIEIPADDVVLEHFETIGAIEQLVQRELDRSS
jgi:acyl carrier protein